MNVPTISTPCNRCGMEKGHALIHCPTCQIVVALEKQNSGVVSNAPQSGWEVVGGIIFLAGLLWYLLAQLLNIRMFNDKHDIDNLFGDDENVTAMVIALCATMFDNGIRLIHIGGLMRMLGVPNEDAQKHDDECFELQDDFYEQIEEMGYERLNVNLLSPSNTLH